MPAIHIKKAILTGVVLYLCLPAAFSQYTIIGYNPVIAGVNYGPYTISGGTWSTADHWCVTNGTLNNTSNTCLANNGTPSVSVTWNGNGGTLSYYSGSNTTPVATYTVTSYQVTNIIETNPNQEFSPDYFPFVPLNQLYTLNLTGSAVVIPPGTVIYNWQESPDNVNWTSLPNANTQNYTLTQAFTQTNTYIRRVVYVELEGDGYTDNGETIDVEAEPPVTAGGITPTYISLFESGYPGTFTATAGSGGSMCGSPPNYTYTWQTSTDGINWTTVGSGLTYTPGDLIQTTYIRILDYCGPVAGVANAVVYVYGHLSGGTIGPSYITAALNTSPGMLTGNAATDGNPADVATYTWEISTDDINFTAIANTNSLGYTPPATSLVAPATYFRRQATFNGKSSVNSNNVTIIVKTPVAPQNYIQARTITASGITSLSAANALTALSDVKQTNQYVDGVGRPAQTVNVQGSLVTSSGAITDLITPVGYDPTSRQPFSYLPYASASTSGNYDPTPFPDQQSYNSSQFHSQGDNLFYYGQTDYELSPLARTTGVTAPGDNWTGANRGSQIILTSNGIFDNVIAWNVTNSGTPGVFGTYSYQNVYRPGTLSKQITTNENGVQSIEFKDFNGNIILKKVQLSANPDPGTGSGYTGWLCTYYIYDNFNNLRCQVQPAGVQLLAANGWNFSVLSGAILSQQCFRYEYDQRNRVIMKQVPGAQPQYTVYDNLDRVVMTQNGVQRPNGQWEVTLYENALDRPVATGIWTNTSLTFASLLSAAYTSTAYPFTITSTPSSGWELLTQTHYDNYSGIPSGNISGTLNTSAISTAYFYSGSSSPVYAQPLTQITSTSSVTTQGLVTWNAAEVLGSNGTAYIYTSKIYDNRGRIIQEQTQNASGGVDLTTTQYNFVGKPVIEDLRQQQLTPGGPTQNYELISRQTYDALGRPVKTEKLLINILIPSPSWKTVATMSYDALGRMTTKTLGNNPAASPGTPLETQTCEYNIRGWLLGVNRAAINSTAATPWFSFELGYDKAATIVPGTTYAGQQYDGNVAGTIWKNAGDQAVKKYDLTYDAANRLMTATYGQYYQGSFNTNNGLNFNVNGITYDANGNLGSMNLTGWKNGSSQLIDQLSYTPIQYSNQLQNVIDNKSDATTTLGDFRYSAAYTQALGANGKSLSTVDYSYDANGNLTVDKNKDITSISYDYLNQPAAISVAGQTANGTVTYTYDAMGNKLSKKVIENNATVNGVSNVTITTTTSYDAGFVYQSLQYSSPSLASLQYTNNLQFISDGEGRIRGLYNNTSTPTTLAGFAYDYFLKDQVSNTRAVITEEQEVDPYPELTFDGTTQNYANQNAVWDNASGQSINVASSQVTPLPVGFNSATNGTYCGSITKAQGAIGAAKLIRVMAGDQLNVTLNYTYSTASADNSSANGLNTLLNSLAAMILGSKDVSPALENSTTATALASAQNNSVVSNFLSVTNQEVPGSAGVPKAYLHILLFNDQFVFDNVNSIVYPITSSGLNAEGQVPAQTPVITKDGYAYIYFSNESNTVVYFDNFQLTHVRGPLLETTDYYPFGLTMAAVSASAMKTPYAPNKYRFNGKELQNQEFNDGSGLQEYDFGGRMQDPQLGRWWVLDPKADLLEMSSPYAYCYNNPLAYKDPDGELSIYINGRVDNDEERPVKGQQGPKDYWPTPILNAISNSGIPNSSNMFFVDGDRAGHWTWPEGHPDQPYFEWHQGEPAAIGPEGRELAGQEAARNDWSSIIGKLKRDSKTHKIVEKIEIYTHSRGAAFGAGYISELLFLIGEHPELFDDPQNEIDLALNLAPHQSGWITEPGGVPAYSIDHFADMASGSAMDGLIAAFTTAETGTGGFIGPHSASSFLKDVTAFTQAFAKNKGDSKKLISDFISKMKNLYGINVQVTQ
jgi:RHS repeat-associated protein